MIRIRSAFEILALMVGMVSISSCIENQKSLEPDGQIVVIGNGLTQPTNWTKTLVADVRGAEHLGLQSLIIEDHQLAAVQDKLPPAKTSKPETSDSNKSNSVRLDWIAPKATSSSVLLKLSLQGAEEASSDKNYCPLYQVDEGKITCMNDFDGRSFASTFAPRFLNEGSYVYLTDTNELQYAASKTEIHRISENVKKFEVIGSKFVVFENEKASWALFKIPLTNDASPEEIIPLASEGIVFVGSQGEIFWFLDKATDLFKPGLYQYDLLKRAFLKVWTVENWPFETVASDAYWVHDGALLIRTKNVKDMRGTFVRIHEKAWFEMPLRHPHLEKVEVSIGKSFVWFHEQDSSKPRLAGELCGRMSTSAVTKQGANAWTCKTLLAPEHQRVSASVLETDQLVVALSSETPSLEDVGVIGSEETSHQVLALNTDFSSQDFGKILKSWTVSSPVEALRFFDLSSKTESPDSSFPEDSEQKALSEQKDSSSEELEQ